MKNDLERGAEDIETFGFVCRTLGAIFFCCIGAASVDTEGHPNPNAYFIFTGCMGAAIFITACLYPNSNEHR